MYSDRTKKFLEDKDVEPCDRVEVVYKGRKHSGIIMPRSRQGDQNAVVLKLDNGYNIGMEPDKIEEIEFKGSVEVDESLQVEGKETGDMDLVVLHTGGTIASRVSYSEGGVKPSFSSDELLSLYPELCEEANIETEVVAQMLSEDMEPGHWQEIAETVVEHRDSDGIIIGHGTDTIQYTAAALSFMLENIDIPVVIVGAQRSSDRPSSDAAMNLICASKFVQKDIPGVFVCMHAESSDSTAAVHRATRVRKMHTSRRDTFRSIGCDPVAEIDYKSGEVKVNREIEEPEADFRLRKEMERSVGFLKSVPSMDPEILDAYSEKKGLLIEGTGLGHLPVNSFDEYTEHHEEILEKVKDLAEESLVAMASQCLHGRVNMRVYDAGVKIDEAGVVSAKDMLPETAYVKLMWCLGQAESFEEAEEMFTTDYAGEIREREEHRHFGGEG
ncbi:MAG: Glu-tRNA(Gln) amidotransferase subunit GatD [Candidatus Nanohaloarchaea archaeon]|nr:Glu-tRNA(Gln) amidotransferase subunit GatD [Candidatus Nanohaloarchaea archaeon]